MNSREKYNQRKMEVQKLLAEITEAIANDEFEPKQGWANVGTIAHYQEQLQDVRDSLLNEGEYAPENVGDAGNL